MTTKDNNLLPFKGFRKKPIMVEAFQLTEEILKEKDQCIDINGRSLILLGKSKNKDYCAMVQTNEGIMYAKIKDWIIKGVKGEIYPCSDDIFMETYGA